MPFSRKKDKTQQVRVSNTAFLGLLGKRVLAIVGYSVMAIFILYLCLASTITRIVPTTSGSGLVPVKENTFIGGNIPKDTYILVDLEKEQKKDHFNRLKQSFIPSDDAAVIRVQAGPFSKLKWMESGVLVADGSLTEAIFKEKPENKFLENEYVGVCVSGACATDEGVIVPKKNIYGILINQDGV